MSGPGTRAQSVRGSSVGSAKRDDIIGLKARCASAVQTRGASVGNRAPMNGGAMSRPSWRAPSVLVELGGLQRATTSSGSSAMHECRKNRASVGNRGFSLIKLSSVAA